MIYNCLFALRAFFHFFGGREKSVRNGQTDPAGVCIYSKGEGCSQQKGIYKEEKSNKMRFFNSKYFLDLLQNLQNF